LKRPFANRQRSSKALDGELFLFCGLQALTNLNCNTYRPCIPWALERALRGALEFSSRILLAASKGEQNDWRKGLRFKLGSANKPSASRIYTK